MWTAVGIILGIAALFAFLLLLPVHIILKNDRQKGMVMLIRVLFITVDPQKLSEKKAKKPKVKKLKTKEGTVSKTAKKILGISDFSGGRAFKQAVKQKGVAVVISEAMEFIKTVLAALSEFIKKVTVKKLHIHSVSADTDAADAAMDYGLTCSVVYPVLGFIQSAVDVKERGLNVDIRCDFEASESEFYIETDVFFRIFHLLSAVLYIASENVKKGATK